MKKKNEVEIQSKGIEQKADGKYKLVETHNGHVTLLNFNFSQLIAIFCRKIQSFLQPFHTQKSQTVAEVQD